MAYIDVAKQLNLTTKVYYDKEPIQRLRNLVNKLTEDDDNEIRLTDLTMCEMQKVLRTWVDKPAKISSVKDDLSPITRAIVACTNYAPPSLIE